jgi:hypothetical protein
MRASAPRARQTRLATNITSSDPEISPLLRASTTTDESKETHTSATPPLIDSGAWSRFTIKRTATAKSTTPIAPAHTATAIADTSGDRWGLRRPPQLAMNIAIVPDGRSQDARSKIGSPRRIGGLWTARHSRRETRCWISSLGEAAGTTQTYATCRVAPITIRSGPGSMSASAARPAIARYRREVWGELISREQGLQSSTLLGRRYLSGDTPPRCPTSRSTVAPTRVHLRFDGSGQPPSVCSLGHSCRPDSRHHLARGGRDVAALGRTKRLVADRPVGGRSSRRQPAWPRHTVWVELTVEVFPVSADRWVAVIDAPRGAFSTECQAPEEVAGEVASSIDGVLGHGHSWRLVDDRGCLWSPDSASDQLLRMLGPDAR